MKQKNNELVLNHTPVFSKNLKVYEEGKRFIINQGGSRSSKTYSICQLLLYLLIKEKKSISVVRKSLPSLKSSVMKDFFDILKENNIYNESNHNKTENVYEFGNGSEIHFFSVDDEQKIRGRKHSILFLNEANELSFETFNQLAMRCEGAIFIDFNPSDIDNWIYKLLENNKEKAVLIKSTYKDNPFLSKEQVDYIENLINVDLNYYKIYALGEQPTNDARIFTHFKKYIELPENRQIDNITFGLDFGFNHPSVLVKSTFIGNQIYVEELLYKKGVLTKDLISELKLIINNEHIHKSIYCDFARPEIIEELRQNGFNAVNANKAVKEGIDYIKSKEIFIKETSENLWKESKLYCWKMESESIVDEPVKTNDDGMDALRYSIFSTKKKDAGKYDYEYAFI